MTKHVQCRLSRGTERTVSWIPKEGAVIGAILRLKEGDVWEDGWQVTSVGSELDSKVVQERANDHRRHRKATDV